jgi:hypothetical protein
MAKVESGIPHNLRKVYRRLQRWRSLHTGRLPIPERLWAAAAELAREHGIYPTAKALHLEYGKLKQRAEAAGPAVKRRGAKVLTAVPRRALNCGLALLLVPDQLVHRAALARRRYGVG